MKRAKSLGELKRSGYRVLSVKEEMRKNLLRKIQTRAELLPGIYGYEETVVPQVENAILSGHDIILLGERGQAKSRIARTLIELLDEEVPTIAGCEINDNPFKPICMSCRQKVQEHGDDTEIVWINREQRYGEKLATPDTTIADLIGEVDPIKVAEGRYLSDELTIHYGLVPRTNRGIFCLNELPDLAERIQVGLLNIMEERDVQIRGYKVRLPLDLYVVASANPEDYTNRGRIITPLKDRFGSQVRTHYPRTIAHEMAIMEQEQTAFEHDGLETFVPQYMREIVAEITHHARKNNDINQRSGVSVRVSICNFENVMSSALKRAVRMNEKQVCPRISDLNAVAASSTGKIELEAVGEAREDKILDKLIQGAVTSVFNRYLKVSDLEPLVTAFESGLTVDAAEDMPSMDYVHQVAELPGLKEVLEKIQARANPSTMASGIEFVLEGLHLNRKLNKDRLAGRARYRR